MSHFFPFLQLVLFTSTACMLFSCTGNIPGTALPAVETGVSKELATYRSSIISQLGYELQLEVPPSKEEAVQASEIISFYLK